MFKDSNLISWLPSAPVWRCQRLSFFFFLVSPGYFQVFLVLLVKCLSKRLWLFNDLFTDNFCVFKESNLISWPPLLWCWGANICPFCLTWLYSGVPCPIVKCLWKRLWLFNDLLTSNLCVCWKLDVIVVTVRSIALWFVSLLLWIQAYKSLAS